MLRKGDIVFYATTGGPIDEAIVLFSHATHKITHCAIWVEEDKTIEANFLKDVGYATVSQYKRHQAVFYKTCPQLTDEQRDGIVNYLLTQFGEGYDYMEIAKIFLEDFHVHIPYHEEHRRICSSLIFEAYKSQGIILCDKEDDSSPEDIFDSKELTPTLPAMGGRKVKRLYPVVNPISKGLKASNDFYQNSGKPRNPSANLRPFYGEIQDQGQFGACTAFSSLQFRMSLRKQAGLSVINPSYFANYYEERLDAGTVSQDSGATITEAVSILERFGAMPETDDPYTPADFAQAPPNNWVSDFKLSSDKAKQINPNTILEDTLDALSNGHPVLFGTLVFEELEGQYCASTGQLTMPVNPSNCLGGHAVNAIGYDEERQMILVLNQWSANWGIHDGVLSGCFWMPYEYFRQYASDAWVGFADDVPQPVNDEPLLGQGSQGDAVKELQTLLNEAVHAGLAVDGIFGERTLAALQQFQRTAFVTGKTDKITWEYLKK